MYRNLRRMLLAVSCIGAAAGCSTTRVEFPNLDERRLLSSDEAKNPGAPFTPKDCPDCRFEIVNRSGRTWTDFHLEMRLGRGPDGRFGFITEGGGFDGDVYEADQGADNLGNANRWLDVTGLNVADGSTYTFTVDIGDLELEGTWELFGRPTVDGPK